MDADTLVTLMVLSLAGAVTFLIIGLDTLIEANLQEPPTQFGPRR